MGDPANNPHRRKLNPSADKVNHLQLVPFMQQRHAPTGPRNNLTIKLHGNAVAFQPKRTDNTLQAHRLRKIKTSRLPVQHNRKRHTYPA